MHMPIYMLYIYAIFILIKGEREKKEKEKWIILTWCQVSLSSSSELYKSFKVGDWEAICYAKVVGIKYLY